MYPAVLLGSIFTLFTAFWCCIRPDFPSPHDSKLKVLSTKLDMVLWAMRQWFEAGQVAKEFQDRGWTRRHGLFLQMGGFLLCDENGKPSKVLSFGYFKHLLNENTIAFPTLTSLEIQERNNFHPAIGFISTWFLMHCIITARHPGIGSPLPAITQLEAVTATIAISSWCILFFAWKKPLDARTHILLQPIPNYLTRHDFDHQSEEINHGKFQREYPQTPPTSFRFTNPLKSMAHLLLAVLLWLPKTVVNGVIGLVVPELDFRVLTLKRPLFCMEHTTSCLPFLLPPALLSSFISVTTFLFAIPCIISPLRALNSPGASPR